MPLTSIYYMLFLCCVMVVFYTARHRWRLAVLILASLLFYYINQHWYVLFLVSSILVNYLLCSNWIKRKQAWSIYMALAYNILVLAFFKYLPGILFGTHIPDGSLWEKLILPIGISFFSFQAIGYVLDVYWGGKSSQPTFGQFSLYMTFFPQLLSGPIARSKQFIPQIDLRKSFDYNNIVSGARLILWGLFKKLVIANNLSPYTDAVFNNIQMHKGLTFIIAVFAYVIQIYTDFSGYSDIAIGSARTLGFTLLENFRMPYFASSVTDFWRRWHISLSSWVRDYVNTPLQYKFRNFGRTGVMVAAYITFFIIGLWHGARWNFVLFGLIQGSLISYEVLTVDFRNRLWSHIPQRLGSVIANLMVFGFFACCAILLRVSISDAAMIFRKVSTSPSGLFWGSKQLMIYSVIGAGIVWLVEFMVGSGLFTEFMNKKGFVFRWSLYLVCTVLIILIGSLNSENFIYFQF